MTIDIDKLTVCELKELQRLISCNPPTSNEHPYTLGKLYFIRTVTLYLIGKLEWVGNQELKLSQASWIVDTGRFHDAIKTGKLKEVEPFIDDVIIGRGSVVDVTEWKHDAPRSKK